MSVNNHPLYATWGNMVGRCTNPKNQDFKNWGGRGISICARWRLPKGDGFRNFVSDMGPKPTPMHTLERKNNDGNYEPKNCKWATRKEQALNCRNKESQAKAVKAAAEKRMALTHCKRGHKFTKVNTFTYKGNRSCKECRRAIDRFIYHGKKGRIEDYL